MKKRFWAALLAVLIITNICACDYVPENINGEEPEVTTKLEMSTSDKSKITTATKDSERSEIKKPSTAKESKNNADKPQTLIYTSFESYESIISIYRKVVEICPRYEEVTAEDYFAFPDEMARNQYEKIFISTWGLYPRNSTGFDGNCYERFGYTIKDINKDGAKELILRLDDHQIIAIFTMVNEKPVFLDHYWNRKGCWIDPDGYLHVSGSSGADKSVSQIYCISDKTGELILLEEGGTSGHDEISGNTLYYKLVNNEKVYITKEEYNSWQQSLTYKKFEVTETISEYMPFIFLFNEDHPAPEPYVPQAKG